MFSALHQGSSLYVLDKQNKPTLRIGTIVTTTQPTGFNMMPYMQNQPWQTIDVTVQYDDGTTNEFKQMQSSQSVAVYGNVIITETREQMLQQIDEMERTSKAVIDTIPYHNSVLEASNEMRSVLSPSFAKEKETDARITNLEKGIGDIKELLYKMSVNNSSVKSKPQNS